MKIFPQLSEIQLVNSNADLPGNGQERLSCTCIHKVNVCS